MKLLGLKSVDVDLVLFIFLNFILQDVYTII